MHKAVLIALRVVQFISSAVIVGVAANAAKVFHDWDNGQHEAGMPGLLYFTIFAGGFTVLVALEGIFMTVREKMEYIPTVVADGLSTLLMVGGGCALATWIAFFTDSGHSVVGSFCLQDSDPTSCFKLFRNLEADTAFLLLGAIASLGLLLIAIFKRGSQSFNRVEVPAVHGEKAWRGSTVRRWVMGK